MNRRWLATGLVPLALCLIAISAAVAAQKAPASVDRLKPDVNVDSILKGKRLQDGLNLLHTNAAGVKLSARVKDGKITEFVAIDKAGAELSTETRQRPVTGKCMVCVRYSTGSVFCYEIDCNKLPPPIRATKD